MLRYRDIVKYQDDEFKITRFVARVPDDLDSTPVHNPGDKIIHDILVEERDEEKQLRAAQGLPCNKRVTELWALPENATHVCLADKTVPITDCRLVRRAEASLMPGAPLPHTHYVSRMVRQRNLFIQKVWV